MNGPEYRSEYDPYKASVESFFRDMGNVSRTIISIREGDVSSSRLLRLNFDLISALQRNLPDITNHSIKGSNVRIVPNDEGGKGFVYHWFPWKGGMSLGNEPVEGIVSDIYPGIGVFIDRGPGSDYVRFVETTSDRNGKPTCEITVLTPSEKLVQARQAINLDAQ